MKNRLLKFGLSLLLSALSFQALAFGETKHLRVKWNPLGMILGEYSGSVDVKVHKNVAVGVDAGYLQLRFSDSHRSSGWKGWSLGGHATFGLGHELLKDGWVLSTGASYRSVNIGGLTAGFAQVFGIATYEWHWEVVNLNLGLGAQWISRFTPAPVLPYAEFSLGFAI